MDTSTENHQLTGRQRRAIPFLAVAKTLEEGCQEARIATSTVYLWLRKKDFREALEKARNDIIGEALSRLKTGVVGAVDGLVTLSHDADKETRRHACCKILDFYLRLKETDELEARIERIEQILDERG